MSLAGAKERADTSAHETAQALAHARAEVHALRDDLEGARLRIERLAGDQADAERLWRETESRLGLAVRERDDAARRLADATRQGTAVPTLTELTGLQVEPATSESRTAMARRATADTTADGPDAGWTAVRMATRFRFHEQIDVQINGGTGVLVDLSVDGCQVLADAALRPNQAVKVQLPLEPTPVTCSGKVVWAKLEAPLNGRPSRYRAGVQFSRADDDAIETLIISRDGVA